MADKKRLEGTLKMKKIRGNRIEPYIVGRAPGMSARILAHIPLSFTDSHVTMEFPSDSKIVITFEKKPLNIGFRNYWFPKERIGGDVGGDF